MSLSSSLLNPEPVAHLFSQFSSSGSNNFFFYCQWFFPNILQRFCGTLWILFYLAPFPLIGWINPCKLKKKKKKYPEYFNIVHKVHRWSLSLVFNSFLLELFLLLDIFSFQIYDSYFLLLKFQSAFCWSEFTRIFFAC